MSLILLGILNSAAGSSSPYWMLALAGANNQYSNYAIASDESSNVYIGLDGAWKIAKVDPTGSVVWARDLDLGNAFGRSANENKDAVYETGTDFGNIGSGGWEGIVSKRNTSGVLQWQRNFGTTNNEIVYGCHGDFTGSPGSVYIAGNSGNIGGLFVKLSPTNGNLDFAKHLVNNGAGRSVTFTAALHTAFGYVYSVGTNNFSSGSLRLQVCSWTSLGGLNWQRYIGDGTSGQISAEAIAVDSNENIYVTGGSYADSYGGQDIFIAKYNSGGALLWQRQIGGSASDYSYGVSCDSSDNVYVFANSASVNGTDTQVVIKYSSSGTLQYQRFLNVGGATSRMPGRIAADDTIVMSGNFQVSGVSHSYLIKLPLDGSLTGTWTLLGQSITYGASSLSNKTTSHSNGTSSQSVSSASLTFGTPTKTDNAYAQTETLIAL